MSSPLNLESTAVARSSDRRSAGREGTLGVLLVGLCGVAMAVSLCACDQRQEQLEKLGLNEQQAQEILEQLSASARPGPGAAPTREPPTPRAPSPQASARPLPELQAMNERWIVDELEDLAPASPAAAHSKGVFMVDGQNRLWLAKLGRLPRARGPVASPIQPIPDNPERFPLGRAPSLAGQYAYWVSSHYLLRRPIVPPYEPLEVLAEDARVGTRVAAMAAFLGGKKRDWAAYVALPTAKGGALRAKLWHGSDRHLVLTPEASSSLAVQLALQGDHAEAFLLEARTGMTTVHRRRILATDPLPKLGPDEVLWVGGSAHSLTELHIASAADAQPVGLLPIEQDISHFGLAMLGFGPGEEPAQVHWETYKNGISPSPVTSATVCERVAVVFVRPSTPEPGAPQELVLSELSQGKVGEGLVLGRSKAFYDVSLSGLKGGALLSYVADYRTWARTLRCVL